MLSTARALCVALALMPHPVIADGPLIIAHRGASGYLPEHTLAAKALAHGMRADYLEQDVVLSRDGVPVILHDIHLEPTTDVATRFPGRARSDGHFYAIDFSLAELRELKVSERVNADGSAVFPTRFPAGRAIAGIPTLTEEIDFIDGLNTSSRHQAGLYIEMKGSAFHSAEGQDLPAAVMAVLGETGYADRSDRVFLQSFEPDALRYLKNTLQVTLPLIQLIGENAWQEDGAVDFDYLRSDAGLDEVASYADGIGPWLMQLYRGTDAAGQPALTDLAGRAQQRGLLVHPYTLRADQLPPGIDSFSELHRILFVELGVDGIFTDFPDLSVDLRAQHSTP